MNDLGEAIRALMSRRDLTGGQLSEEIGLSATSVSRFIRGHAKPKQVTLSRSMKRLCVNPEHEQLILCAFTGVAAPAAEEPVSDDPRNAGEEREWVERWMEARTRAIPLKNAVARELEKAGIPYLRDAWDGIASDDLLLDVGRKPVAIECKFNVSRDFEKTVGIARLLRELMRCDFLKITAPFEGDFATSAQTDSPSIRVVTVADTVRLVTKNASAKTV